MPLHEIPVVGDEFFDDPWTVPERGRRIIDEAVEDVVHRANRTEQFQTLLDLGARTLAVCQAPGGYKESTPQGTRWISRPFPLGGLVTMRLAAFTSRRVTIVTEHNIPYFKTTSIPRPTAHVTHVEVLTDAQIRYDQNLGSQTVLGDCRSLHTTLPDFGNDWDDGAEFVEACLQLATAKLDPSLGLEARPPQAIVDLYRQNMSE